MTPEEYFGGWYRMFDKERLNTVVEKLRYAYATKKVYPDYKNIFKAFHECSYDNISVVIIGQDPYFDGSATGIAFANNQDTPRISPSLQVLKDCVCKHTGKEPDARFDNTLTLWAHQGVLLLNSYLTVEAGKPGSHSMLWIPFISDFIRRLGEYQTGIVYVLMGNTAKMFKPYIGRFNDIIEVGHPAYYARMKSPMPDIFEQIDKLTMEKNGFTIKWM